jgi:hypothetical protein
MLTIICGEDNVNSRNYFLNELKKLKESGNEIKNIYPKEIENIFTGVSVETLFGQQVVYAVENLNKYINKKSKSIIDILYKIAGDEKTILIDWEDETQKRFLKYTDKVKIVEFKPDKNIFKLLDQCYPSNLKEFISTFSQIVQKTNEYFILIMLTRHIKKLLLYKINIKPQDVAYWQEKRLIYQSKFWLKETLINFYNKLIDIEVSEKIGKNPYGIKNYIEMLSCYYIK